MRIELSVAVLISTMLAGTTPSGAEDVPMIVPPSETGFSAPCAESMCAESPCVDQGCDVCCDGGWKCCRPSRWRHLGTFLCKGCCCTTGDLFPHYPYFPERHGYYDFAPYNPGVLEQQIRLAPALGEPITNPFKRALFPGIYAQHENTAYPEENGDSFVPRLKRVEAALPDLEAILDSKPGDEPLPPPAPGAPGTE